MNKQKIYFRADAGANTGYGHFIRSLALADMLKQDFDCVLFTACPSPYQVTETEQVCHLVSLPADESKFDVFLTYLTGDEIVVLDNYFYTTNYQQQIKDKGCKLVCIDDMHDKHFVSDVIINHGIVSAEEYDAADYTQIYTSPKYALLRNPFLTRQPISKRKGSWIVTIGGLDEPNITTRAVKQLQQIGISDITAIVGDGFKYLNILKQTGVNILSRLTAQQMAENFAVTENVVCCASTVCYEALSQGCKVHAGWYVNNQVEIYNGLKQNAYIAPLGNLIDWNAMQLSTDYHLNYIDFRNVRDKIRGLFICLAAKWINYTDLSDDMSHQVWECRNQKDIRACMTNPNPFSFESHKQYVQSLKNNDSKIYMALFFNGSFVASFDLINIQQGSSAERGLFVNPPFQKMGIGKYIEDCIVKAATNQGVHTLKADVLKNNLPSVCYHEVVGYQIIRQDDTFYYMEKEI